MPKTPQRALGEGGGKPTAASAAALGGEWSLAERIALRFACSYFVLYFFPFPIGEIPGTEALAAWYVNLWNVFMPWVGKHILYLRQGFPPLSAENGSGDAMANYVQNFCLLALAAVATLVWTLVERRRRDLRRLHYWTRVYVRYALATILLSYGFNKVIKLQFPFPSLDRLLKPIGERSPMGLLWDFMGYSKPYTFFAGAMEVLGGMLLFFRRTTTLGALVLVSVLTNVVLLNFSYDVPVKLFSLNLLLAALFLLVPDLRRLLDVLVLNRTAAPADIGWPLTARWMKLAAAGLKTLFIGFILYSYTTSSLEMEKLYGEKRPRSPVYGAYEVDEFVRNGQALPPLATDAGRWKNVICDSAQWLWVRSMNDQTKGYAAQYDAAKRTVTLSTHGDKRKFVFTYSRPDKDHLVLVGRLVNDALAVKLHRVDESRFLLVSRGFHWINEVPFNR